VALATAAQPRSTRAPLAGQRLAAAAAALLALTAGIHASVAPGQLRVWRPAGALLLIVALGQTWWALSLLRRRSPRVVLAALWSTVAVVGGYAWSRTAGLPFAPVHHTAGHLSPGAHAGHAVGGRGNGIPIFPFDQAPSSAEPVGAADLTVLAAELAVIVLLVLLLPERARRHSGNVLLGCGVVLLALRATVLR
jgi:hypothetical protein